MELKKIKRKRRIVTYCIIIFIATQILPLLNSSVSYAASLNTNLLLNPGGEEGGSIDYGWQQTEDLNSNTNKLNSENGGRTGKYLRGFAQNYVDASVNNYQDVDISSLSSAISAGKLMVELSGYYMKADIKEKDYVRVKIQQFDVNGKELDTKESECKESCTISSINWEKFEIISSVQKDTTKIRVSLIGLLEYPGYGKWSYFGYDDMSLIVSENNDSAPVVSQIDNQTMDSGETIGPIAFTVTDSDTSLSSVTATGSSSNEDLISSAGIVVILSNGNGTITIPSTSEKTGTADITVAVFDGIKTTNMVFTIIVIPAYKLGSNLVRNGDGGSTEGWVDTESRIQHWGTFKVTTVNPEGSKYYMYQDMDITKFSSMISAEMLEFTSSCTILNSKGEYKVEGYSSTGDLLWTSNSGAISTDTRMIRVTVGGLMGAEVDDVSVVLSVKDKISDIPNQAVKAGDSITIPFTVTYGGSEALLTASSTNNNIILDSSITFAGSDYNRNITFTAQKNVSGTSDITVKIDGKSPITFTVNVYTVPEKPSITSVQEDTNGFSVAFSAPGTDGGRSITGYKVICSDGKTVNGDSSPIKVTGLTPGESYTFTVSAINEAGEGAASDSSQVVKYIESPKLTTEAVSTTTSTLATITGNVISDGGSAITERGVEYKKSSDHSFYNIKSESNGTGSYTINLTSLEKNTQYDVRAYVVNSKGTSYGNEVQFTTLSNTAPVIEDITNPAAIEEDTATEEIAFTISDDSTSTANLQVTATSDNTSLVPNNATAIVLGGTSSKRTIQVKPVLNQNGTANITIKVKDEEGAISSKTFMVTVSPVNDVPVADNITVNATEDTNADGTLSGTDIDSSTLTYGKASKPAHGSVTVNSDGTFRYTPDKDYYGDDFFIYFISDEVADSKPATVTIHIAGVNDDPSADSLNFTLDEDSLIKGKLTGKDAEGNNLTFSKVSDPINGSVMIDSNGKFTYTPTENYYGSDSFTYLVSDGNQKSLAATVTLTVNAINDVPVVKNGTLSVTEDVPQNGTMQGTDIENDSLSFIIVKKPTKGSVTINADGTYVYTPHANATESDRFTYKANDGKADSGIAQIQVMINGVNDLPKISNIEKNVVENKTVSFTTADFTSHFTDVDEDQLSKIRIETIKDTQCGEWKYDDKGTLSELTVGKEVSLTDVHKIKFVSKTAGVVSLTWKGSDGTGYSDQAMDITINITKPASSGDSSSGGAPSGEIPAKDPNKDSSSAGANENTLNISETQNEIKVSAMESGNETNSDLVLKSDVIEKAKTEGKTLSVKVMDTENKEEYTWAFQKKELKSSDVKIADVNLKIQVDTVKNYSDLVQKAGNSEITGLVLNFAHEGELPCQASVKIYVGDQEGVMPGSRINLYHYNKQTTKLEELPYGSDYYVNQDGYVTIQIVHCSDYVVLNSKAPVKMVTPLEKQIKISIKKTNLKIGSSTKINVKFPSTLQAVSKIKDKTNASAIGALTVSYSSTNEKVAVVNKNGKITAVGKGNTVITITVKLYNGKTKNKKIKIHVK